MSPLWRCVLAALVALALPLQALETAWARAGGPAHVHVSMLAGWAAQHHHDHHHHHGDEGVGHHHHAAADPAAATAVWLDTSPGADLPDDGALRGKPRSVLDFGTLQRAPRPGLAQAGAAPFPAAPAVAFASHVSEPPERPPRSV